MAPRIDYLIVSVLVESEHRAVLCAFGKDPNQPADSVTSDGAEIHTVNVSGQKPDDPQLSIAITCLVTKGNVNTKSDVKALLRELKPRQAFLVGTACGIETSTRIGDVVVSVDGIYYYETNYTFDDQRQRPQQEPPRSVVAKSFERFYGKFAEDHSWKEIREGTYDALGRLGDKISRPAASPDAHMKVIASGEKIVEPSIMEKLGNTNDLVYAADQEAWGFASACKDETVDWMVIRGVSDFGNKAERKRYAVAASANAASYLHSYLDYQNSGVLKAGLPKDDFFVRVAIGEITKKELKAKGLDIARIGRIRNSSATDIVARLTAAYSDWSIPDLLTAVNNARATAFETKYKSPDQYLDERDIDRDGWATELNDILFRLGPFDSESTSVIDVGCGNAQASSDLIEMFTQYTGIDIAGAALQDATTEFPAATFIVDESETLSRISSSTFDLYVSLRTYQSALFSKSSSLLQAFRVLKPSGSILISIPFKYATADGVVEGLKVPGGASVDRELPYRHATYIRQRLHRFGFSDIGVMTGQVEIYIWAHKPSLSVAAGGTPES